jgi:hypothetical protein
MPRSSPGQLYVSQAGNGSVGEYNATTGAALNANFIALDSGCFLVAHTTQSLAVQTLILPTSCTHCISVFCVFDRYFGWSRFL